MLFLLLLAKGEEESSLRVLAREWVFQKSGEAPMICSDTVQVVLHTWHTYERLPSWREMLGRKEFEVKKNWR